MTNPTAEQLSAALALLVKLEDQFGGAIDADDEIPGADAVEFISEFVANGVRPLLAQCTEPPPDPTPEQFSALGASVDSVFGLRPDPNNRDRFRSNWGSKTTEGVGRSVLRLVEEWRAEQ